MRLPVPARLSTPCDGVVHDVVGHKEERLQLRTVQRARDVDSRFDRSRPLVSCLALVMTVSPEVSAEKSSARCKCNQWFGLHVLHEEPPVANLPKQQAERCHLRGYATADSM